MTVNSEHVQRAWVKALRRKSEDPEGAITAARTLVETVCKHILDEEQTAYPDNADLPNLYHLVVEQLYLASEQYTESLIRKILGSCQSVVGGIAALRNQLGDAHGKSAEAAIPHPLLAELAVNLAGAMAKYLLAVWESSKKNGGYQSERLEIFLFFVKCCPTPVCSRDRLCPQGYRPGRVAPYILQRKMLE